MEKLVEELKIKMVDTLNLIDITPAEIDAEEQLVGGKLGIDSIDVLELVMMIEKDYGVRIESKDVGEKVFASLDALALYIHQKRGEALN